MKVLRAFLRQNTCKFFETFLLLSQIVPFFKQFGAVTKFIVHFEYLYLNYLKTEARVLNRVRATLKNTLEQRLSSQTTNFRNLRCNFIKIWIFLLYPCAQNSVWCIIDYRFDKHFSNRSIILHNDLGRELLFSYSFGHFKTRALSSKYHLRFL